MSVADLFQELRELGLSGTLYRAGREARIRTGLEALLDRSEPSAEAELGSARWSDDALMGAWTGQMPFGDPATIAELRPRIPAAQLAQLGQRAELAARGKIRCFGRWQADYGHPIDWHVNPLNGRRWPAERHWSIALRDQREVGDVKLTWEVARFPQAYELARAATFGLRSRDAMAAALDQQIRSFVSNNPFGRGIHWNSGQEIVFRLMAWTFSVGVFAELGADLGNLPGFVARAMYASAWHVENQIDFSKRAVYNNHLLAEALGLVAAAWMLPPCESTVRWARVGSSLLDEQADRQVYRDGAYIQQSHNYHRVALQDYLWACALRRSQGFPPPAVWLRAMERSLDFLVAHQNPGDGRLPNYGANDGAMPSILSCCDFSDFRPVLQALSVVTRGERLYEPGPWDEAAAWLAGRSALDAAALRPPTRVSVSFPDTGYHVLRGRDAGTFSTFRCGSVRDRFSQIDMLHLDVFWRGQNVLVDAGSYRYNEADEWHSHFLRTESHNTLQVDGLDQMLHFRQFKCLYWTQARLLGFEDQGAVALCSGEHDGFQRHPGRCIHRRSVLFAKDDLWIVADRISGTGHHDVRLHWLGGEFPADYARDDGRMTLETPAGAFSITVLDEAGAPLPGTIVSGQESPPRGWLSRYYAERVAVPSLAVVRSGEVPVTTISVLAAGTPEIRVDGGKWSVTAGNGTCVFSLNDGIVVLHEDGQ